MEHQVAWHPHAVRAPLLTTRTPGQEAPPLALVARAAFLAAFASLAARFFWFRSSRCTATHPLAFSFGACGVHRISNWPQRTKGARRAFSLAPKRMGDMPKSWRSRARTSKTSQI